MSYPSPTFTSVNLASGGSLRVNGANIIGLSGTTIQLPMNASVLGDLDITGVYRVNGVPIPLGGGGGGTGDMSKAVYDSNNDGKVNAAATADVATAVAWTGVTGKPTFASVATTGAYADLTGKPTLSTVAATGAYGDLTGKPTLATVAATGSYTDLINKPTSVSQTQVDWNATTGIASILNKPTLAAVATTGAYGDISGKPTLATVATTGAYTDLSGRPALATVATTGAYSSLSGAPSLAAVATTGNYNDLFNKPVVSGGGGIPVFNVKTDYGAFGNNASNDTAAIQNAINAATNAGGGIVYLPRGVYRVSALTVPYNAHDVIIAGESHDSSILSCTSSTADTLTIGSLSGVCQHCRVERIGFVPAVNKVAGAELKLVNTSTCYVFDITTYQIGGNKLFKGVAVTGAAWQTHLRDVTIGGCNEVGITCGDGTGLVEDLYMHDVLVGDCADGILLSNVSGLYGTNVQAYNNLHHGVVAYPATGWKVKACMFTQLICDTNHQQGMAVYSGGGIVVDNVITNSWFATNTWNGLHIDNGVNGFQISNSQFLNNGQNGALTQSCNGVIFSNCQFKWNSVAGYGWYNGLQIADGGNHVTVSNCQLGSMGELLGGNQQGYGLGVNSPSNLVLVGNATWGNAFGGKTQASTPSIDIGNLWQ